MEYKIIHNHNGGHFLKNFEVRDCKGRFFVYRETGDYTCDAPTKKEIFEKLAKHLHCNGLIDNEEDYINSIGDNDSQPINNQFGKITLNKRSRHWIDRIMQTILKRDIERILEGEPVEIGYRETCGAGKKDPTHYNYEIFSKLIKSLKCQGVEISKKPIKHGNAYASNNGGFWQSAIYQIHSNIEYG